MIEANFESRNFHFTAYGETETDALKALKKGLLQHSKDYGLPSDWWKEWTSVGVFDDDCVYYKKIEIGRAYRDSELLKK
jgi:hypothetical protein